MSPDHELPLIHPHTKNRIAGVNYLVNGTILNNQSSAIASKILANDNY